MNIKAVLIKYVKTGKCCCVIFPKYNYEMSELGMFCPPVSISMFSWQKCIAVIQLLDPEQLGGAVSSINNMKLSLKNN